MNDKCICSRSPSFIAFSSHLSEPPTLCTFWNQNTIDGFRVSTVAHSITRGRGLLSFEVLFSGFMFLRELWWDHAGACGTCPSSTSTMKMGVERVLREKFGNAMKEVVQVDKLEVGATMPVRSNNSRSLLCILHAIVQSPYLNSYLQKVVLQRVECMYLIVP